MDVALIRKKTKMSQKEFSRQFSIPLSTLRQWEQGQRVPLNPAAKVKLFPEKPKQLRVISADEFVKLYNSASDSLKTLLMIAVHTGLRRSEILNLKRPDINFEDKYIIVRESKNGEIRHVPINSLLMETLEAVVDKAGSGYLFPGKDNAPIKSVKKAFLGALRRSGIPRLRFHDLRHSFGSKLSMAGVDIATIQELVGHKDISATKRYLHPSPEHKKAAVERLEYSGVDTYLDTKAINIDKKGDVSA